VHPVSHRSQDWPRLLVATTFLLALAPSTTTLAQENVQEAAASSPEKEQPRRRERRRAAEAAASQVEQPGAAETVAATAPAVSTVEPELVCKSVEVAGSKISRRVCGTPEQWASQGRRASRAAQDAIQEIRDRSSFPAPAEVPTEGSVGIPAGGAGL
jgi:hypothetical protein